MPSRGTWSANHGNRFEAKAGLRNVGSRDDDFMALSRGPGCYRAKGIDTTLAIRNSRCVPSVRGGGFANATRPLSTPSMEFQTTGPGCYIGSWSSFFKKDDARLIPGSAKGHAAFLNSGRAQALTADARNYMTGGGVGNGENLGPGSYNAHSKFGQRRKVPSQGDTELYAEQMQRTVRPRGIGPLTRAANNQLEDDSTARPSTCTTTSSRRGTFYGTYTNAEVAAMRGCSPPPQATTKKKIPPPAVRPPPQAPVESDDERAAAIRAVQSLPMQSFFL